MIVFNLPAIIVAVIIAIIYGIFSFILPDSWLSDDSGFVVFFSIATVVSALLEVVGVKGRLFWLPMWLFGLVGLGIFTYSGYGGMGLAVIGGVAVAMIGGFGYLMVATERSEKREAPDKLREAKQALAEADGKKFWNAIKASLLQPFFTKFTREDCKHNIQVVELLQEALASKPNVVEQLESLKKEYENGMRADGKIKINSEILDPISEMIDKMVEKFDDDEEEEGQGSQGAEGQQASDA